MKTTMRAAAMAVIVMLIGGAAARPAAAQQPSGGQQIEAMQTLAAVGQHAWTDGAQVNAGALMVYGWAFECSTGSWGYIDLVIDGLPVSVGVLRSGRPDVSIWATRTNTCDFWHTPYYSGVYTMVMLKDLQLAPGLHTAAIRVGNQFGMTTISTKAVAFVVPAA